MFFRRLFIILAVGLLLVAGCAQAPTPTPTQTPTPTLTPTATPAPGPDLMKEAAEFYKGKTIHFRVVFNPGGSYDLVARALAPFLSKHTGATVVVENMPGAGGLTATNHLYEKAEQDGLNILIMLTATIVQGQLVGDPSVRYNLMEMNPLGNVMASFNQFWVTKDLPYNTVTEMIAHGEPVRFACTTQSSFSYWVPEYILGDAGVKAQPVRGYKGSPDETLSVVRGETESVFLPITAAPIKSAYDDGTVKPIVSFSPERIPELPDVQTVYEENLTLSEVAKFWLDFHVGTQQYRAAIYTNQNVLGARVRFLREALRKSMEEPELLEQIKAMGPAYDSGEDVAKAVDTWLRVEEAKVKPFRAVLGL
ncbi:Bug family tripartite tricarboxylate transporter substrate binding protein [Chloroflexota bacterium]